MTPQMPGVLGSFAGQALGALPRTTLDLDRMSSHHHIEGPFAKHDEDHTIV